MVAVLATVVARAAVGTDGAGLAFDTILPAPATAWVAGAASVAVPADYSVADITIEHV